MRAGRVHFGLHHFLPRQRRTFQSASVRGNFEESSLAGRGTSVRHRQPNRGVSRTEWLQRGVRFAIGELHEAPLSRLRRPTSVQSRSGGFKESRREEYVSYDPHGRR